MAELLQGKQYEVQLPKEEQPMAELLQGKLINQKNLQPMYEKWPLGEQAR